MLPLFCYIHCKLYDVQTIFEALFLAHSIPSSAASNILLFIDEIQESPKAIQLLRYFYVEIPALHVITIHIFARCVAISGATGFNPVEEISK